MKILSKVIVILLINALWIQAQNPGDPVPGVGGEDSFLKFIETVNAQGTMISDPVQVSDADFLFFDPLDPELGEFFSQMGVAILAMNVGDWQNMKAGLAAVDLEKNQLVSVFGENGIAWINTPFKNDYVRSVFVQPDGKIVAGGYSTDGTSTYIAVARFLPNGQPDPSFGTDGVAYFSQFPDDRTDYQYTICSEIAPVYDSNNNLSEYLVGGTMSSPQLYGRVVVDFDSSGKVIKRHIVACDTNGNPIGVVDVNGAAVLPGYTSVSSLQQARGRYYLIGGDSQGYKVSACTIRSDTFMVEDHGAFNPDTTEYPSERVDVAGAVYYPDPPSLFIAGNFTPDIHNPSVYDSYVPFVCWCPLDESGRITQMLPLSVPSMIDDLLNNVIIRDVQNLPAHMPDGPLLQKTASGNPFYVVAQGERRTGEGKDVVVICYKADGSPDTEFGDNGVSVLDFVQEDKCAASAINASGDFLVCVDIGDDVAVTLLKGSVYTSVGSEKNPLPEGFILHPVHPNPFNPQTAVSFRLNRAETVRLTVLDLKGRVLKTLLSGPIAKGDHRIVWDGSELTSGTYIVRLETASQQICRKAILLR